MTHHLDTNTDQYDNLTIVQEGDDEVRVSKKPKKSMYPYILIAIVVVLVACAIMFVNNTMTRSGYHFERTCTIPIDSGIEVIGTRRYLNMSFNILGHKFVDVSKSDETTRIDSSMLELGITGITGNKWFTVYNPAAEPRQIILQKADTYVFNQGGKSYVVSYEDFCK